MWDYPPPQELLSIANALLSNSIPPHVEGRSGKEEQTKDKNKKRNNNKTRKEEGMKRNKILSSAFVMTMASFGAFGADKIITSANTCTVDVLGVSENNAVANTIATWDAIEYTLNPGQYLNVTETDVATATCPAGSYCVGGGFTVETANNSIAQCPTGYPNSADGASADTQCYIACTTDMVPKATAVKGNDYYGTGTDTCEPTECMAGWRVKPGLDIGETIGADKVNSSYCYVNDDNEFYEEGASHGQDYYGISGKNSFAVNYEGKGILTGHGRCSTKEGDNNDWNWTNPTIVNNLEGETGMEGAQYCYCQIDGFTPAGGTKQTVTSAPWVFSHDVDSADRCAYSCANSCASTLRYDNVRYLAFRAAVVGNIPASPATCEEIVYTLKPGQYLPAGGEEPVDCPDGSYCPGGETVYWNKDDDQGIKVCPSDYPYSDTKSGSEKNCYHDCATDDIAGSMTVVGRNYYGDGADTCSATECLIGWHVKPGLDIGETIGTDKVNSSYGYVDNNDEFDESGASHGQEYYGISGKNSFAVDYAGKGILTGHGRCSTQSGVRDFDYGTNTMKEITIVNTLTDETGTEGAQYCYCQVDGFTPTGGDKVIVTSAPWVFNVDDGSADYCADDCAAVCASLLRGDFVDALAFRAAMFGVISVSATCEANTINIDWNPDNGGDHIKNMCTYEGSIELPTPDPVKPGYTFTGWKLVE